MVALLVFILATLESFWPKKLLDAKDPFGDNVFKNPARCTRSLIGYSSCDDTIPFCASTQTLVPTHQVWTAPKSLRNLTLISITKYTNLLNFPVVIREGICKTALFYYYDQNIFRYIWKIQRGLNNKSPNLQKKAKP